MTVTINTERYTAQEFQDMLKRILPLTGDELESVKCSATGN